MSAAGDGLLIAAGVLERLKQGTLLFGLLAVIASEFGRGLGLLEFKPGGSSFDTLVRPIFLGIFIVALLVAMRWEIAGGLLAIFAAAGLIAFTTNQLTTTSSVIVVGAFAIPAVFWIAIDVVELSRGKAILGLLAALALAVVGYLAGQYAYDRVWGPTHPETVVEALPDSPVEWLWSGHVTSESARVRAKIGPEFEDVRLVVGSSEDMVGAGAVETTDRIGPVVGFEIDALEPDTTYYYALEIDGEVDAVRVGRFNTFPSGPASFTVAFGACARVGSNGRVFDTINRLDPLLYLNMGDFHYGDNDVDDIQDYREVLDITLTRPAQAALYRSRPIAYVWDDHDYGANDSDATSIARAAAMSAYREYVPSYELAGPTSSIYQAFTIGRVRFIMTDARSSRDPKSTTDDANKTMLGAEQKRWLLDELVQSARTHEVVVWVNPVPWVAEERAGADNWAGYSTERREIAGHIAEHAIDNLVMVSGDAHMVAIDDGTNTNYSDEPGPGFPLLHAAALDRPGGFKGGPYSEGAIPGSGQFGTLEVIDDGQTIEVVLRAHDWQGDELLAHRWSPPSTK